MEPHRVCGAAAGTLASTRGEVGFGSVSGLVAATRTSSTARTPRNSAAGSSLPHRPSVSGYLPGVPVRRSAGLQVAGWNTSAVRGRGRASGVARRPDDNAARSDFWPKVARYRLVVANR